MSSTATPRMTIRERARTADFTIQAVNAIVQITTAKDPAQLLVKLVNATAAIGASASLFSAAIPEGGDAPSCFTIFASHPDYANAQDSLGPILTHPWFRFARTHSIPGTDRQVHVEEGADQEAIDLASQYGFRSCFIVPTTTGAKIDRIEMLCLGSDDADDFEGAGARIVRTLARSLAAELHDWLTRYLQQRLRTAAKLTAKDVALLAMEWQGLCTKEIATRTGVTIACVDSRFQRINTRLNCAGRKASATRAAAYGLLELT